MATYIIAAILFGWVAFVGWRWYKKRKDNQARGGCNCHCADCPHAAPCTLPEKQAERIE